MGKKVSAIGFWTSSEPVSLSDDVDRRSELPDISPPTHKHGQNFIKNAETAGS